MEELVFFISAKLEEMGSKKRDTSCMKTGSKQTVLRNMSRKKNHDIKKIGTELLRPHAQVYGLLQAAARSHGAAAQAFVP